MRPSKYLTADEFKGLFFHNGRYWFLLHDEEVTVVPAVGDIIEYENGERNIICFYSSLNEDGHLALDVRMFDEKIVALGRRGRAQNAFSITPEVEEGTWPPKGSRLIRDGRVIYPISKCYYVINKLVALSFSLKIKDKLLSLQNMPSRVWSAISDTFSKLLNMLKNMLKKLKNIFY